MFSSGVDGLLVALCCHHRCNWKTFVGKDWFIEHGLGPRQFSLITSMSAWATCGMKHVAGNTGLSEVSVTIYFVAEITKVFNGESDNCKNDEHSSPNQSVQYLQAIMEVQGKIKT